MSEQRLLQDLPGYQPLGVVDALDAYLQQKRAALGDDAGEYLSDAAWHGGRLAVSPDQIDEFASKNRQEKIAQQGSTSYIGELASKLIVAFGSELYSTLPVESTALTTLFRDEYGVNLAPYMEQSTNRFCVNGRADRDWPNSAGLNYMADRKTHGNTFWQINLNGPYGFANMHCVLHDFPGIPLRGEGNIALIPGVQEALAEDIRLLVESAD